jgi:capsular exopolysaccharide synthesis family protein
MGQVVDLERKQQLALRDDLERIIILAQDKLRRQRQELRGLADVLHSSDSQALTAKQRNTLEEYAALKRELLLVQAQLRQANLRLTVHKSHLRSGDNIPIPDSLVEQYLDVDPGIQTKALEVAKAQDLLQKVEETTTPVSPARSRRQAELRNARENLEKLRAERRPEIVKRLRQKIRNEAESGAGQIGEEITLLEEQKHEMDREVKRVGGEAERIGTTSLDLEMKKADIDQADGVVKLLQHEKERLSIQLQATALRRVTLLERAEPPTTPNLREHVQETVLVGLCALALGVLGVSYREYRARWINTPDEVTQDLGMRVVGTLPALSNWFAGRGGDLHSRQNEASLRLLIESIDGIRAILSCDESAASTRVLMVTSAHSREGKTMLAGQLATSFARAGQRTLLIDGDLRNPRLHQLLNLSQSPGFSEVLRGETDVPLAIRPTNVPGLSVLPAGQLNRSVLTSSLWETGRPLFERLRAEYKFIVVDSCPVLPVADSLMLGQHVDAAVLCIRPRVSRWPSIRAAQVRLQAVRIRVVGTVVNGVRINADDDYYRYVTRK